MKIFAAATALMGAFFLAGAPQAQAGLYYEARTTVDKGAGSNLVHAWIDETNARIEFIESDVPTTKKGSYLITRNSGQTLYMVNPQDETYSEWDLAAMMNLLEGMSGLVNLEFSEPKIELLDEKSGGDILGYSTRYFKYHTTYDIEMRVFGMRNSTATDTVQEMWVTNDFELPALGVWLRKGGRSSGDSSLDRVISKEMEKVQGFPLKSITVSTSSRGKKKKKQSTSRITTEVTTLRQTSVDAKRFEIPANYKLVDAFPAGGAEGEENPLSSIFGRRK